jgi:ubiquinone/menaquinone biosynthesis C-methylase UbiE
MTWIEAENPLPDRYCFCHSPPSPLKPAVEMDRLFSLTFAMPRVAGLCAVLLLAGCEQTADSDRPETAREFPRPDRPVSGITSNAFSTEEARDDRREAETVMAKAAIAPGMTVADIGAGEGYYTVRLAAAVGAGGRVLAQDIDQEALARLADRVERERLDNVSIKFGDEDNPRLPANSFDRVFMVHMYHEITEPYAFLWHLRPALRPGGQVIVVDIDRPTDEHGIAPQLLFCEFQQLGYRLVEFDRKPEIAGYYAQFEAVGERPRPDQIEPCAAQGENATAATRQG